MPRASQFTTLLRECCEESVKKGYSVWGISQEEALVLRRQVEPGVGVRKQVEGGSRWGVDGRMGGVGSFFPGRGRGVGRPY